MSRWMLGIAGVVLAGLGAWQGDDLAATVADLGMRVAGIEERLEARPIGGVEASGALRFAGGPDRVVSEPFDLPAGTTLVTYEADGLYAVAKLLPAPGTGNRSAPGLFNGGSGDTAVSGTVAVLLPLGGSYVLAVDASGDEPGAWSVVLEP